MIFSHILKKQKKLGEISFSNIFYLTQHMQNVVISIWNQYKNLLRHFTISFLVLNLQNAVCVLHLQHISIWTSHIQMLNNHMWLMGAKLYSPALALWRGYLLYLEHHASINFLINFMWSFKALLRTHNLFSFVHYQIRVWIQSALTLSQPFPRALPIGCPSSVYSSSSALIFDVIESNSERQHDIIIREEVEKHWRRS